MKKILVCTNYRANPNSPSCAARGSKQVLAELTQLLKQNELNIQTEEIQCLGFCKIGPNVRLMPNGQFFHEVSSQSLKQIIKAAQLFLAK